jgi:hypothetical protein
MAERESLTAFPQEEAKLRRELAAAPVAHQTLRIPLARCDLARCGGMCCYDGIYVEDEAAGVLQGLAQSERSFFQSLGLDLPEQVIVNGAWRGRVVGPKTAVVPHPFSKTVAGYPGHFENTACAFLVPDGRCSLQVLAQARGKHKWYYKPFGCWLHPLTPVYRGRPQVGLENAQTDSCAFPDYPGFVSATFCGRECPGGEPAAIVLSEELAFVHKIVGA